MSQLEKLIEKIRRAKTDVRFIDLDQVLRHAGYVKVRQKGSHVHFRKPDAPFLTIPTHRGTVKAVYVKEIFNLLDL